MANDLRLRVIMDLANKASGPLRNIEKSSADASKALKAARDTLKNLNEQQRAVDGFTRQQAAVHESSRSLKLLKQELEALRHLQGASARDIGMAEKAVAKQTAVFEQQRSSLFRLRSQLNSLGIGKVSEAQARLKAETDTANTALEQQLARLKEISAHQGKLRALNRNHGKEMMHVGVLAGAGVGMQAAGRGMARPVLSGIGAYAQQESATSQLKASMMLADGSVSAEFKQINELAMRLGDKLPGTTTNFIDMMKTLKEQGISAKSILGGTGEAAAYLGVQLKMPAAEAAKFAAQMQDATKTPERDMMALMDTIQRVIYTGVESGYMLQGFSKMSSVLGVIKQEGVQAANTLAPLLSMMNQSGMTDGGSAGNAIRKVIDGTLNTKHLGKANALLDTAGAGFKLNFTDAKGNFAGLDNVFAQLQKIKNINSDTTRKSVLKEMFGDDAETLQVLEVMMDKGKAGYEETIAKLKEQADLRMRVNAELGTIANLWDAASGSFTNVMAAMGQTIAPEVKAITTWLGEVAASTRAWIAEHPVAVGWIVKITAVLAGLLFGLGTLAITLASVMGPFFIMRFVMGWLGLKFNLWASAIRVVGGALTWLRGVMLFLAANPVVLAISAIVIAIAAAAYLIYKNWEPISAFFSNLWATVKTATSAAWEWIKSAFFSYSPLGIFIQNWGPITAFFSGLWSQIVAGVAALPERFMALGGMLMDGLAGGISSRVAAVKDAIGNAADSALGWFKEKLGIRSPSRVFMAAGVNIGEGAALGISNSSDLVRRAGAGMAAAAAMALPAISMPALALPELPAMPAIARTLAMPAEATPALALPTPPRAPAIAPAPAVARPANMAAGLPEQRPTPTIAPHVAPLKLPDLKAGIELPGMPAITLSVALPKLADLAPGIQLPNVPAITPRVNLPKLPDLLPGIQLPNIPAITPGVALPKMPDLAPGIKLPNMPATLPGAGLPQLPDRAPGTGGDAPLRMDARAPLAAAGAGQRAPTVVHGDTITIQITAAPGTDPQALARAVSAELDRRERAKAARVRSALGDIH